MDETKYNLVIDLVGVPELPNTIGRRHFRQQAEHTLYWRSYIARKVGSLRPPEPLAFSRVTIELWRYRRGDRFNVIASCKPLLDGLLPPKRYHRARRLVVTVGAGVIVDDADQYFYGGSPTVKVHTIRKPEKPHTRITVEEMERA